MAAEPSTTTADAASVVAARHEGWFTRISSAMRDPHYRNFYIGNVMLLVLNLPMIALWVKLLQIPAPLLYAGILVFATIGTYGITQSPVDLVLLYLIGAVGYLMRRYDVPTAPVIIGMILGPLAEQNFRQALTISAGDWTVFFTRPLSLSLLILALLALAGPKLYQLAMKPKPYNVPGDA